MNRERFITLLEREQEGLLKFLLALCEGNYAQAQDLAQEVSLKAYLSYSGFIERFKFSTWLYRIAYHSFIDYCRKKRPDTDTLDKAKNIVASENTEFGQFEELYMAIDGLPVNEKTAILLFYMEEMRIIDIALIMHRPAGTIKSYLNRGRQHLKSKLKK